MKRRYKYCVEWHKRGGGGGGGGKWKMVREMCIEGVKERERERDFWGNAMIEKRDFGKWLFHAEWMRINEGFLSRRRNRMLARDKNICVLFRVYRGKFHQFENLISDLIAIFSIRIIFEKFNRNIVKQKCKHFKKIRRLHFALTIWEASKNSA